jgi:hypothetical protein
MDVGIKEASCLVIGWPKKIGPQPDVTRRERDHIRSLSLDDNVTKRGHAREPNRSNYLSDTTIIITCPIATHDSMELDENCARIDAKVTVLDGSK